MMTRRVLGKECWILRCQDGFLKQLRERNVTYIQISDFPAKILRRAGADYDGMMRSFLPCLFLLVEPLATLARVES